jgi:Holliday junction resolvase
LNKKHTGARNEHLAIAHLLSEGYEVFKNVSQHGIIDVLAVKGGQILRADIKGVQARPDGSLRRGRLSSEQIAAEIISIAVHPDNSVHIDLAPRRVARSPRPKA